MFLNIYSKGKYPADALSNFASHPFDFDGFEGIQSMEGLSQSPKFEDIQMQQEVLFKSGREANECGRKQAWHDVLYWKGKPMKRCSKEYTQFIERAYDSMFENEGFREALKASKRKILVHTIGKTRRSKTVLTWWEFCGNLNGLRKKIYH